MDEQRKCDKYEAYFVFKGEEELMEHLKTCEDCALEHQKYLNVSKLVKEVAPEYLKRQEKKKINKLRSIACCMIAFVGLISFSGIKMYDNYNFQTNYIQDTYISTMGLPVDDYGFLEL